MSTGISISSINRIKELAEHKKYAEALEILDTQDLDKSINPQFLRISGEIFRENKRYYDSRRILLRAHQMSPQGLRIIYELIQLYLELGYFSKAQRYYEQYQFFSTPEDTQRDFVEYNMKKARGVNIKELAAILIPILERMPEDRWNFEAILLYDKMKRKDKALEECRYILENYKDSIFVNNVIEYIDDKLDVDAYFYVYPKREIEEDRDLFGKLIDQEEEILKKDYLSMYPPEAKIMVEVEDKEGIDTKQAKEKKKKKKKKSVNEENTEDNIIQGELEKNAGPEDLISSTGPQESDLTDKHIAEDDDNILDEAKAILEAERIRQERESALEKILSKRVDTEQVKESAKQVARVVKSIDTEKAKNQVRTVAEAVKDNVKKATETLGEAVGAKGIQVQNDGIYEDEPIVKDEEIVDGIIESILEPPKKTVGQVVTNEELDALIPDSLEAMSTDEIAELEAKKAEEERLELEALEAQLRLDQEKKANRKSKTDGANVSDESGSILRDLDAASEQGDFNVQLLQDMDYNKVASVSGGDFAKLREQFLAEQNEDVEEPLESLGFIKVVQSDIDADMEEQVPDAASILHQMIDNREFYTGEDSTKFESKASYENHGFEIEGYDFNTYLEPEQPQPDSLDDIQKEQLVIEGIFAKEEIFDFDEMIPDVSSYELEKAKIKAEEARRRAEEEARIRAEEARRRAEEEARIRAEEEARQKAEEEARIRAEVEARRKAEEEARIRAEEEARRKAEEEARIRAEEEARRKAEEEARIRAEEEARRKAEEEARIRAEEEARQKAEEEARIRAEEEARRKAEEEARIRAEEEARRKAEEEARIRAEEEARRKAEEEARIRAEEEARRKAEEEARIRAEEEARRKAEEEARIRAEEEARRKAEEEARIRAEEEARREAEEEARKKAEKERLRQEAEPKEFRERLRFRIVITDEMVHKLLVLKESR